MTTPDHWFGETVLVAKLNNAALYSQVKLKGDIVGLFFYLFGGNLKEQGKWAVAPQVLCLLMGQGGQRPRQGRKSSGLHAKNLTWDSISGTLFSSLLWAVQGRTEDLFRVLFSSKVCDSELRVTHLE